MIYIRNYTNLFNSNYDLFLKKIKMITLRNWYFQIFENLSVDPYGFILLVFYFYFQSRLSGFTKNRMHWKSSAYQCITSYLKFQKVSDKMTIWHSLAKETKLNRIRGMMKTNNVLVHWHHYEYVMSYKAKS